MTRLFAIARNAFVETIRQPIYVVLILVTFAVLVLDLPLSGWSMGTGMGDYRETDQQMMVNLGLSTLLVSGLFLAAFSAAGVLSREIEDKTILTVVSKPVARPWVVLGKFLGVAGALIVAYYLCSLVFLMTVRHKVMPAASDPYDFPVIILGTSALGCTILAALFCNYFFGWHFASATVSFGAVMFTVAMAVIAFVGRKWTIVAFGSGIPADLLLAMLLMLLGVVVFAAVAVAASTRLGQVMTLLVCCAFFFLGSMSQYLFGRFAEHNLAARGAYWVLPNLTFFYALDAVTQGRPISWGYVGLAGAYTVCHVAAMLAVGIVLFQRRELEAHAGSESAGPRLVVALAWAGRGLAIANGLLAIVAVASFSFPASIGIALAHTAGAVFGWLLWSWFGLGVRWTYYFALVAAVAVLAGSVTDLATSGSALGVARLHAIAAIAFSGVVLLILLLPKTRHHFGFARKPRKTAQSLVRR